MLPKITAVQELRATVYQSLKAGPTELRVV